MRTNGGERMDVAHHQGDRVFLASGKLALETEDAEVAPTGREVGGGDLLDGKSTHRNIIAAELRAAGR